MPIEFKERGNVSMVELLSETGYSDVAETITETTIENYLRLHSELVDTWVMYSEDQRCTPAWYLSEPFDDSPNNKWTVGFVQESGIFSSKQTFPNRYSACANFIKKYIELLKDL